MVARLERLEGSAVTSWQRCTGGGGLERRWQGGKGRRVVKWQGGRFLVLFKSGGHRVSSRFYLFISDVDQQWNKGAG